MAQQTDWVRDQLEEDILTGVLKPGERLDEASLATRFGVSRTPIREALFQLGAEGLLIRQPRRGNFVAEIGPRYLMEMFDVMAELEAMAARLAARRATTDDLIEIRKAHEACSSVVEGGDTDTYYYLNETFHQSIRNAAHNLFLVEQIGQLQKRLKAYRRLQLRTRGRMSASFSEHNDMLQAIEEGDDQLACDTMRAHVAIQGERFAMLLATIEQERKKAAS